MKTRIAILAVILIGIGIIFFLKGCPSATADPKDRIIDSLTFALKVTTNSGEARFKSDSSFRVNILQALQDTTAKLEEVTKQLNARNKQIATANKTLHAALVIHDTPTVYKTAQYLSFQIDSMMQEKWNVDRELDRQKVLNEQLHYQDSISLAHCRDDLKNTRSAASMLVANEEQQHQQDQQTLKKAKKGRWLDRLVGAAFDEAVRGFVNIFKK